ncbi:MAG: tyrosine-type recombinase/integrase [Cyclobacteriaceae bacterium]
MGSTKLVIRKEQANSRGLCTIFVLYCHHKQATYFTTREQIEPRYWDRIKCRVKKSYQGHNLLNQLLFKKKNEIDELRMKLELQAIEPFVHTVREKYKNIHKKDSKPPISFHKAFEEYLIYKKSVQKMTDTSLQQVKTFYKKLCEFESDQGIQLWFGQIDKPLYEKLLVYYYDQCNYSPGMIRAQIKWLKAFLNWAKDQDYHSTIEYLKFKRPAAFDSEVLHLTETELKQLFAYDFTNNKPLERARDLFVLAATSGLRYSDVSSIGPENIVDDFIIIRTRKTAESLKIPLNSYSRKILKKYKNKVPKLSIQRLNLYLKEAARIAGLDAPREITTMKGGVRKTETLPIWKLVRTHLSRKTFITLSLEKGMTLKDIAAITGHKGNSIQRYVTSSEKRISDQMKKYWGED